MRSFILLRMLMSLGWAKQPIVAQHMTRFIAFPFIWVGSGGSIWFIFSILRSPHHTILWPDTLSLLFVLPLIVAIPLQIYSQWLVKPLAPRLINGSVFLQRSIDRAGEMWVALKFGQGPSQSKWFLVPEQWLPKNESVPSIQIGATNQWVIGVNGQVFEDILQSNQELTMIDLLYRKARFGFGSDKKGNFEHTLTIIGCLLLLGGLISILAILNHWVDAIMHTFTNFALMLLFVVCLFYLALFVQMGITLLNNLRIKEERAVAVIGMISILHASTLVLKVVSQTCTQYFLLAPLARQIDFLRENEGQMMIVRYLEPNEALLSVEPFHEGEPNGPNLS